MLVAGPREVARGAHHVGVEMCAPRSGNQKGSVERLVDWVKSSFFKHRKFQDELDLPHVAGTLFLYEDRLRIVAGRFESLHRRRNKGDPPAPLPEHRASLTREVVALAEAMARRRLIAGEAVAREMIS